MFTSFGKDTYSFKALQIWLVFNFDFLVKEKIIPVTRKSFPCNSHGRNVHSASIYITSNNIGIKSSACFQGFSTSSEEIHRASDRNNFVSLYDMKKK